MSNNQIMINVFFLILQTFTLRGEELEKAALFWTYMFLVLAVVSGFSFWLQVSFSFLKQILITTRICSQFNNVSHIFTACGYDNCSRKACDANEAVGLQKYLLPGSWLV